MLHPVETIAAINLAGTGSRYSEPFLGKIFAADGTCPLGEAELCLEADFIGRADAEKNRSMLQLVSYTLLINPKQGKIFVARRSGGEERLAGAFCIGFGGHVKVEDYRIGEDEEPNPLLKCAKRELGEELKIRNKHLDFNHLGFARSLSSPTSEHIGSIYYVTTGSASLKEKDSFSEAGWATYEEFNRKYYYRLEDWSKAVYDYIYEDDRCRRIFNIGQ